MRNQKSDIAGVLFGLLLLLGLGQTYAPSPLGFDMADNPFNPYHTITPPSTGGLCLSNDPCNLYDFEGLMGTGVGTCVWQSPDTDGDGSPAYDSSPANVGDWTNFDAGCLTLQDWDQDGTCDHRVYDSNRNQFQTEYQPTNEYFTHVGMGFWAPAVGPSICTGWVGV